MVLGHPSRSQQNISPNRPTRHRLRRERGGRGTTTSRTTTRASNELSPPKSACSGDAVLRTSTRGTVMGQCAPEDSISQCPFLQMIDTAGNPHADGSAAPGARPHHRSINQPFIVLTETKFSYRYIPVWARYSPHRTRVEAHANTLSP